MINGRLLWRAALALLLVVAALWAEVELFRLSPGRPQPLMPPAYRSGSGELPAWPVAGEPNIFFIEPTCIFEELPWMGLGTLQACAVESAILHNPDYQVYVLHTCATPEDGVRVPKGAKAVYAPLDFFFQGTDLDSSVVELYRMFTTIYSTQHAKEVLSLVTLWKYGGIYLTLDYIIKKPLWVMGESWFVAPDPNLLSLRALCLSARPQSAGQQVAAEIVRRLRDDSGAPDGAARLVTSVLGGLCGLGQNDTIMEDCDGIGIVPGELFLPLPVEQWMDLYLEDLTENTLTLVKDAYGVCSYDEMNEGLLPSPRSAYGRLGKDHCHAAYFGHTES